MFVVSSKAHSDAWHLAASARGWAPTEGDEVPQPQVLEVSSELGKRFLFQVSEEMISSELGCGHMSDMSFETAVFAHSDVALRRSPGLLPALVTISETDLTRLDHIV